MLPVPFTSHDCTRVRSTSVITLVLLRYCESNAAILHIRAILSKICSD
jgi:hypothetical protein